MKISHDKIRELIRILGFLPEDGRDNIYYKQYPTHGDYTIKIDFDSEKIEYRSSNVPEDKGISWGDTTTSNFKSSENFVVLECVDRLLKKGYAPQNITLEKKYPLGRNLKGKLDIVISDQDGKSYLMIECKTWGTEYEKEYKKMVRDGAQLFSYFSNDRSVKYLCLYESRQNGDSVEYGNAIISVNEAWIELANVKEIHDHWNKNFKDNGIFEKWATAYGVEIKALVRGRLQPLTKDDSSRIFNQFAEILRHNVVSDKPNAFNKILNLFICKIIDEDKNENEQVDFQWLEDDTDESLQVRLNDLYKKGMRRFLEIDVTDFSNDEITRQLSNINDRAALEAIKSMLTKLRLQKNPEFAFIEVYDDQSFKINTRIVREVVELLQPYQFRYGHKQQFLGDFFELLLNTSIKQETGQYFTPVPICRYIVSSLPIKEQIISKLKSEDPHIVPAVIDFACGTGHFLTEFMDRVQAIIEGIDIQNAKPSVKNKLNAWRDFDKYDWAKTYVYGIDADYRLVKSSKVSSFLNGDGEANIIRANGLDHFTLSKEYKGLLKEVSKEDTKDNGQFDVLIANPPYSVSAFKSTIMNGEESFELFDRLTDSSSEIECLFVERAKQLLKVGGYAGIILPNTILNSSGIYLAAREILLKYFRIKGITELGSNAFMATNTHTVILFLERRPNTDHKQIMNAIDSFFEGPKEITILGIERAFGKYISETFDNISFDDYVSFVSKKPNEAFISQEIWVDYKSWFSNLKEVEKLKSQMQFKSMTESEQQSVLDKMLYEKVFSIEKEKILYFLLTYSQQTVITRVGEKQAEKDFMGYTFSERRRHEGIKMLSAGTKLYDENDLLNQQKANSYIYKSFLGTTMKVDESLNENVLIVDAHSMIDFNVPFFDKQIHLNGSRILEFDTQYSWQKISTSVSLIRGVTYEKSEQVYKESKNTILTADNITLENSFDIVKKVYLDSNKNLDHIAKLKKDDIFICLSSGSSTHVGKVAYIDNDTDYYAGGFMGILRQKESDLDEVILMKYLYIILSLPPVRRYISDLSTGANIKNLDERILNVKIPSPPIDVQKKVISAIEEIETEELKYRSTIFELTSSIEKKVEEISRSVSTTEKLKRMADMNPQKPKKDDYSTDMPISFIEMASVSEDGYIEQTETRSFGTVIANGYTYFVDNDIIIAKITPCMENGKCALVQNLKNGIGFGSTEFNVIRVNKQVILPKFLFLLLNRKCIRESAKQQMTGKSGHRRVPQNYYEELEIPKLPIASQSAFLDELVPIEKQIQSSKEAIESFKERKREVLEKYLK
jgi:type I restriction enzyme M protein